MYGIIPWGASPWGAGKSKVSLEVYPTAINLVLVEFGIDLNLTGLEDAFDMLNPSHYEIKPVLASLDLDAKPPRNVNVLKVTKLEGTFKSVLLVTDRPMSGWPSIYTLNISNIVAVTGSVVSAFESTTFYGLAIIPKLNTESSLNGKRGSDIANPQGIGEDNALLSGSYYVDEHGDLAVDGSLQALKKRILRMCITAKGSYAWAPVYGSEIPMQIKRNPSKHFDLTVIALKRSIAADPAVAEVSIRREYSSRGLVFLYINVTSITRSQFLVEVPIKGVSNG